MNKKKWQDVNKKSYKGRFPGKRQKIWTGMYFYALTCFLLRSFENAQDFSRTFCLFEHRDAVTCISYVTCTIVRISFLHLESK